MMAEPKDKDVLLVGPPVDERGNHAYLRKTPDGRVSGGILGTPETLETSDGYMEVNHVKGPLYEVQQEIAYTRAHSRPSTKQYRDGWAQVFGKNVVGEA